MSLVNIEITLDDRNWPEITCTVKCGPTVRKQAALHDVAASKFQPIVNNLVSQSLDTMIRRKKRG
jgi:hypothetical protein